MQTSSAITLCISFCFQNQTNGRSTNQLDIAAEVLKTFRRKVPVSIAQFRSVQEIHKIVVVVQRRVLLYSAVNSAPFKLVFSVACLLDSFSM